MNKNFKKGQITLLAVILGVLGLTLGLSVASRSLSDLRQASTVDFGTKALAAAEAGAEYGLNQLAVNPAVAITNPCDSSDGTELTTGANSLVFGDELGIESLKYKICQSTGSFARNQTEVPQDEVYQVDFSAAAPTQSLGIFWKGDANGIVVSALYRDYTVNRYAFQAGSALGASSNFQSVGNSGTPCDTFTPIKGNTSSSAIPQFSGAASNTLLLLRVMPVGGSADILVCGGTFPAQYYEVISRAETTNGTIKRIKVTRDVSGTMPAIFDNVLYSGGDIIK